MIWNRWSSLRSTPPPSPTPALVSFKIYVSLKLGELRIYVSCRITFELWGVCGAPLSSLVLVAAQRRWARDIRQPGNTVLTSGQPGWRLWIQTGSRVPVLTTWWHSRLKKTALPQPKPRKKTASSQVSFSGFKDTHCFEEGHLESSVADVIRMCMGELHSRCFVGEHLGVITSVNYPRDM